VINLVSWFTAHDVEDLHSLGVCWVDHSKDVRSQGDVALIQELYTEALVLGRGDKLTLVRVDVEVLAGIDQSEILSSLHDEEDDVLDVEDEWRSPIHHIVDIALASGAHDQVVVLHAHVNHSLSEVKIIIHLVKAIVDGNLVLLVKNGLDVSPREGSIVVAPGEVEDGS
jgi:hypothetical protein